MFYQGRELSMTCKEVWNLMRGMEYEEARNFFEALADPINDNNQDSNNPYRLRTE